MRKPAKPLEENIEKVAGESSLAAVFGATNKGNRRTSDGIISAYGVCCTGPLFWYDYVCCCNWTHLSFFLSFSDQIRVVFTIQSFKGERAFQVSRAARFLYMPLHYLNKCMQEESSSKSEKCVLVLSALQLNVWLCVYIGRLFLSSSVCPCF